MAEISWPPTVMVPSVGRSSPAMRFSSVVLPDPDGPMSARNSAARHVEGEPLEHVDALAAAGERLVQPGHLNDRHEGSGTEKRL